MTNVVCYSGGEGSALVAVEAVRKYGKENVILLNHDISPQYELPDTKRFKQEVADYLGKEIIYANHLDWETKGPIQICRDLGGWKFNNSPILCTYQLKTLQFYRWIKENVEDKKEYTFLYGFDKSEMHRINRRIAELGKDGYLSDYPLARWERTIHTISEIGIKLSEQYKIFKHNNCVGCLKAGRQHWYVVYCYYNHIFEEAKEAEEEIGYSIINGVYMEELEPLFEKMKLAGVTPTEKIQQQAFWTDAKSILTAFEMGQCRLFDADMNMPCDCSF